MTKKSCSARAIRFQRWTMRCQIYQYFCDGRDVPEELLTQAKGLDIFAGRPTMSDEQAVAYINRALSNVSWKKRRKDKLFFQCWFVVGSRRCLLYTSPSPRDS